MIRFDMSVVESEMSLRQRRRQHLIFVSRKRDGLRAPLATADNPQRFECVWNASSSRVFWTLSCLYPQISTDRPISLYLLTQFSLKPIRTMLIYEQHAYALIILYAVMISRDTSVSNVLSTYSPHLHGANKVKPAGTFSISEYSSHLLRKRDSRFASTNPVDTEHDNAPRLHQH